MLIITLCFAHITENILHTRVKACSISVLVSSPEIIIIFFISLQLAFSADYNKEQVSNLIQRL